AQKSVLHKLGDMAQVNVHVLHFAGVDAFARFRIGLIGKPQMDAARHGEGSVEFRAGGGAGEDADLKLLPAEVGVRDAAGQFSRNYLGIAGPGEAAHADLVAGLNQGGRLGRAHDLVLELGVENSRGGLGSNRHSKPHSRWEPNLLTVKGVDWAGL